MSKTIKEIMAVSPLMPVMVINNVEHAVPLAKALVKGGLSVLEITLRTDAALEAIRQIKAAVPEAIVGAGTIINEQTLHAAIDAGAEFIVSPGTTPHLADAALKTGVPFLPGVSTPGEALALYEKGISEMKFFPAEAAGGVAMLKSIGAPIPQITFCPTGGVNQANVADYYRLPNVGVVGGSWMCAASLVDAENWDEITRLSAEAVQLATA
ncbi:MAG TPA: keto-deoxy-phosphogluconate aldolase [Gammaproteobacteria bacterium]|nr:keto-deoxy-phosphogluconate aldolase [Gammaproteobacteria bacterium]HAU06656.1 keto-deoxy-phosphogluconate aldolase [Gammaproteobacteria bacterium]